MPPGFSTGSDWFRCVLALIGQIDQFNRLGWVDRRNSMLVDDLRAITSCKLDRVAVHAFDPPLQPNPIYKEYCYVNPVILEVLEEHILDVRGPLCGHACSPFRASLRDAPL
jgi:hypothetical protein